MGNGFSPFKIIRGIFFLILLFFLLVQISQKVSASEEKDPLTPGGDSFCGQGLHHGATKTHRV